jgi:DNA mismatch repair protein MLH1
LSFQSSSLLVSSIGPSSIMHHAMTTPDRSPISSFVAFVAARRRHGTHKKEQDRSDGAIVSDTTDKNANKDATFSSTKTSLRAPPLRSSSSSQCEPKDELSSSSEKTKEASTLISNKKPNVSISLLPQHVIDQIAAGEVVQRPVSVVKEFLENSLDAGATHIVVHVEKGGLSKLSVTDNGCGIPYHDLPLLATRHATSKLTTVDDFATLATFGFRGEAVASTSMVSRLLTVTTRTADSSVAYSQTYQNGKPLSTKPKPCARTVGTTIVVRDLFYNVPHRQRAYEKRESEEYAKILAVVQHYAIHYPTVGFVCQRTRSGSGKTKNSGGTVVVDCNTSQIPAVKALLQSREDVATAHALKNDDVISLKKRIVEATKHVLSHVLEANLMEHLIQFECSSGTIYDSLGTSKAKNEESANSSSFNNSTALQYTAEVYCTTPDYKNNKKPHDTQGKFLLFLNDRLVDLHSLKRAMEDVYAVTGNINASKPVLIINLSVPGSQVDVNVHPSKRQVALMFQEDIIDSLTKELRQQLEKCGQTFATQPVKHVIRNPYAKPKRTALTQSEIPSNKRKDPPGEQVDSDHDDGKDNDSKNKTRSSPIEVQGSSVKASPSPSDNSNEIKNTSTKKIKMAPSKMIRTHEAARAGAIEPFLVSTQSSETQAPSQFSAMKTGADQGDPSFRFQRRHMPDCPLFKPVTTTNVDLSRPGAFVTAMQCNCSPDIARKTVLVKHPTVRPKRVIPTECSYKSIKILRKRLHKQQCMDTTKQLRQAFFMGIMSYQRSLVQCGEDVVMINHMALAKELFYQLALARFGGGAVMAQLGEGGIRSGIHIQSAIEQALQLEDNLAVTEGLADVTTPLEELGKSLTVSKMNHKLAQQATSFLLQQANMLQDYFSIRIEELERDDQAPMENDHFDNTVDAILTHLPVLLDGHHPQPHGLPIFLLRLANQVDYTEELPCFHGICRELGNYYAMMPIEEDQLNPFVHHTLFPALSYLLLPSNNLPQNGHFTPMTKLSTLYKVFERC